MTQTWQTDKELFRLCNEKLYSAVIGDILDEEGLTHQFLPPHLKPLTRETRLVGRAMPVLMSDSFETKIADSANPLSAKPFGYLFEALDSLKEDEIFVATGGSPTYALWGGLMTMRAATLGAAGAVLDGYLRDTLEVLAAGFPVFSQGSFAQDMKPRGKAVDYRVPISIGGVRIEPGDIIVGDIDGLVVVPRKLETEVFSRALKKAETENVIEKAIQNGLTTVEAFDKFGVM